MSQKRFLILIAVLLIAVVPTSVILGGNPFGKVNSTISGYSTFDSDMINIENVAQTGKGVYVAVLDTGLAPNWKDYFPDARIATNLGTGFQQSVSFKADNDVCGLGVEVGNLRQSTYIGSTGSTHGTHVTSTILGFFYQSNIDAASGFNLPPIMVRGIAPEVTIIPVKVLADYQVPALPKCGDGIPASSAVFGTSEMVAAGIDYVTGLAKAGYRPMVINMSLGGDPGVAISDVEKAAVDRAVAAGVVVVAAAGNEGDAGMDAPGSYAPVISAGSAGWTQQWIPNRMWWLQAPDLLGQLFDVAEGSALASEVYVSNFSGRTQSGSQDLDVLAPGAWVRGPFAGDPGYSHTPWWSNGQGNLHGNNPGNFFYASGTSMATPHVVGVVALMLQKNPGLTAGQVETILEGTALHINPGSANVARDGLQTWGANATGAGLIQADAAVGAS
jgi:subtilisin family serine protease